MSGSHKLAKRTLQRGAHGRLRNSRHLPYSPMIFCFVSPIATHLNDGRSSGAIVQQESATALNMGGVATGNCKRTPPCSRAAKVCSGYLAYSLSAARVSTCQHKLEGVKVKVCETNSRQEVLLGFAHSSSSLDIHAKGPNVALNGEARVFQHFGCPRALQLVIVFAEGLLLSAPSACHVRARLVHIACETY